MKKRLSGSRTAEVRSKKSTKSKKKKPVGQTATFGKPQSGNMEDIALYVRKSGKAQELLEILTSQIQEEQSQLSHQIDEAAPGSKGIFKKKNQPATTGQKVQINAPIKLQNNYIPQQGQNLKNSYNNPDLLQVSQSIGGNYLHPVHAMKVQQYGRPLLHAQTNQPVKFLPSHSLIFQQVIAEEYQPEYSNIDKTDDQLSQECKVNAMVPPQGYYNSLSATELDPKNYK